MSGKIKKKLKKHFVKISQKGLPVVVSTMMILPSVFDTRAEEKLQSKKSIEKSVISESENNIVSFEKEMIASYKSDVVLRGFFCTGIFALSVIYDLFMALLNVNKTAFKLVKFIAEILLIFLILLALFWFVYKLFYPQNKFKDFFNKRTIKYLLIFSVLVCLFKNIIFILDTDLYVLKTMLMSVFIVLCIIYLWYKIFNLDGKVGVAVKNMFFCRKGKKTLIIMISSILFITILKILLNKIVIWGKFISISVLSVLCFFNIFLLYNLCKGRFVE